MDHCEICDKPELRSQYKCRPCGRWVGAQCWNKTAKVCVECVGNAVG